MQQREKIKEKNKTEYQKQKEERAAKNLCFEKHCDNPPVPGKMKCEPCAAKDREHMRKQAEKKAEGRPPKPPPLPTKEARQARSKFLYENGRCIQDCGRPRRPDRNFCAECGAKSSKSCLDRQAKLKTANLCVVCGTKPPRPGRVNCQECNDKAKTARLALQKAGLCVNSCGRTTAPNRQLCAECAEKNKKSVTKLKEQGICVKCRKQPAFKGKTKCLTCTAISNYKTVADTAVKKGYKPFRLTQDEFVQWYVSKMESSNGLCEWCEQPYNNLFVVDHDHVTGEIRGIVCFGCNVIEGMGIVCVKAVLKKMLSWGLT